MYGAEYERHDNGFRAPIASEISHGCVNHADNVNVRDHIRGTLSLLPSDGDIIAYRTITGTSMNNFLNKHIRLFGKITNVLKENLFILKTIDGVDVSCFLSSPINWSQEDNFVSISGVCANNNELKNACCVCFLGATLDVKACKDVIEMSFHHNFEEIFETAYIRVPSNY